MLAKTENLLKLAYRLSSKAPKEIVDELKEKYALDLVPAEEAFEELPLLRITKDQLFLEHNQQTLFFHPSMALLRMINIKRGLKDRFLEASQISEGDLFLDATLGLASDALIASWAVGKHGRVIALESSPLIFMLVQEGINKLQKGAVPRFESIEKKEAWQDLAQASLRMEIICADHREILTRLADSSVDIIYLDPMFRVTVGSSSSIKPLKNWSNPEPLHSEAVKEACRVARKRIILKERKNGGEFSRLGFVPVAGGKYSAVDFGVIELNHAKGGNS